VVSVQSGCDRFHSLWLFDVRGRRQADRAVQDHCGGLPYGSEDAPFRPFSQRGRNRWGFGMGLLIARHAVEADFGMLSLHNLPCAACVFTMSLPLHLLD